ncbi:MAG: restriction endonuclease [Patescibacteria group bacterium]|nr:restriction endonuclease [Patescibacteria group bacterium]MDE2172879.1 restriction endonuclease [Patescibacteria group bacterium]
MNHLISITKSNGQHELFEEEKLVSSLKRVGTKSDVIDDVVDQVEREIHEGMTTADIYKRAFVLLHKHSIPAAVKYSIRRAMMELGPDGFPFEKFVARIFQMWGYEAVTDQTVLGQCVDHEVDVVAWKGDSLAMVEAKYHNEFGMKSDLKVALYVKARFDDIAGKYYDYGGVKRKLTERWLTTNTKFTDKAIRYGECYGLKLLGWNYPLTDNLHEIIEQNGLHPISCLSSLSKDQKKELVGHNVLVCIDVVGQPNVLDEIGVHGEAAEKVLTEAQIIIEQAK